MIDELTPEQEARLPEFRDRWLKIGLSTEPADRAAAEEGAVLFYKASGLKPPRCFVWLDSPLAGALAASLVGRDRAPLVWRDESEVRDRFQDRVATRVEARVWAQIQYGASVPVSDRVEDWVEGQVLDRVADRIWSRIRELRQLAPGELSGDEFIEEAWARICVKAANEAWAKVGDRMEGRIGNQLREHWHHFPKCNLGQHDAGWLSFYSFLHEACGLDCCAPLAGHFQLAESCGWWWPFENVAILTERPRLLKRDEEHRLHCEDGPALAYPDGWGIWAWHGVRVPQDVIERPETLTAARIEGEENIEVRRAMIERIGMETWLEHSGAEVARDEVGVLYRKDFDDDEPLVMVKLRNSSPEPDGGYKDYFLRVPPDIKTPREAVAWSFGLEEGEYKPEVET